MKIMGTRWDAQSHEDRYSEGIPDLSYGIDGVNGWIELKQIEKWPQATDALAKPKKFTAAQINWLSRRGKKGGYCFIAVKVGDRDYFIFTHHQAKTIAGGATKEWYFNNAIKKWHGSIKPDQLKEVLTNVLNSF